MRAVSAIPFHPFRSLVYGAKGMVATSQPAAVLAGIDALRGGGNAADAAVAAAAALAVTEPTSCGLGGDCFALYFDAASRQVTALNGSGRAASGLSLELLRSRGIAELAPTSPHAVTVPGVVAGWCDLARRFGTRPLGDLLAPAVALAEGGFAVAPKTAYHWDAAVETCLRGRGEELLIAGRAPRPGEVFRNPAVAKILTGIAERGAAAFYRGPVAEAIAGAVRASGGVLDAGDLAEHTSTWHEPIVTDFVGHRVNECPPNGQGLTALLALNILSQLGDLGAPESADRLHLIIEALRLAFADARRYIADSTVADVPVAALLDPAYAARRAALIDRKRATIDPRAGSPVAGSDTVYLSAVDGAGNACSFIQSNYAGFGTGIVPPGTGFTLQNRGLNFSLEPGHRNALAPRKRPYHTIIPGMVTDPDSGELQASFGVMGGFMQPQGHVQVLLAMFVDGLDPQLALDRPRVCLGQEGDVALEAGVADRVAAALAARGHRVRMVTDHGRSLFGRGQIIARDPKSGVLAGGSDLRGDGFALGV